jgi:hypothetical protein
MNTLRNRISFAVLSAVTGMLLLAVPAKADWLSTQCALPSGTMNGAFVHCGSQWNFYAGAMIMQRSRPSSAAIATTPNPPPLFPIVNANQFHFGWETGPELVVQRWFDGGWGVEGRYFNNRGAEANNFLPTITTFRTAGIGVTILGGGSLATNYKTDLDSFELNVLKQITPGISVLAGFRTMNVRDHVHMNIATPVTFVDWDVHNKMYGGQIGVNLGFTTPGLPLQFNAALKAGWFGTSADNDFRSTIVGGASDKSSPNSFVGEANLALSYQLMRNLSIRAAYTALYIDKIGLAGETAASTTQVAGGTSSPVSTGHILYHGISFGAMLTF